MIIHSAKHLGRFLSKLHSEKIVLATGVFDVLHKEHKKFLTKAKKQGSLLLVGVESDQRVTQLKGSNRPINTLNTRLKNLNQLKIADVVFPLPQKFTNPKDHENLIQLTKPHILAVSSHTKHLNSKKTILEKYGGQVRIVHSYNPKISTTQIVNSREIPND